jgi:hypothetical protein
LPKVQRRRINAVNAFGEDDRLHPDFLNGGAPLESKAGMIGQ